MLADPPSQSRKEVATSAHLSTGKSHHIPEIFHSLPLAWVCMKSKVEPTIISSGMTFFGNQNEWSTIRFSGHSGDQNIVMPWIRDSRYAGQPYLATRMDETQYISQVILVAKITVMPWIRGSRYFWSALFGHQNGWNKIHFAGNSGGQNNSDALDEGFNICWSALFGNENGWHTIHFSGHSGGPSNSDQLYLTTRMHETP